MHQFLSAVSALFVRLKAGFLWVAGAARDTRLPPGFYLGVHVLLVVLTVGLLGWFSPRIVTEANVPGTDSAFVRRFYCGIVALFAYLLVRVTIYVVRLFLERDEEFADVRRDWEAALAALERAELDVQWLPVFLVVGAAAEEESLFKAARMTWKATGPGRDQQSAAVRVYASDDGIFIACHGVGATAAQRTATGPAAPASGKSAAETIDPAAFGAATGGGAGATLDPSAFGAALAGGGGGGGGGGAPGATLMPGARAGATLMPGGGSGLFASLAAGGSGVISTVAPQPRGTRPLSQEETDLARRRLEFLCGLIAEARGEFCPANGLLLVLPLSWSDLPPGPQTDRLFQAPRTDVETVRESLGLAFPVTVAFTGLEAVPGYRTFVERGARTHQKFQDSRAGSKFPPGAPVDATAGAWAVDAGLHWFREWCYSLFSNGLTDPTNRSVYLMLCDLQVRRDVLARQLQAIFEGNSGPTAARLSGVYYCAAGRGEKERALVNGVFQKVVDSQDEVAWTAARLGKDSGRRTLAYAGLAAAAAFVLADGYLAYRLFGKG